MSDHNKCPSSEKEHEKCIFRLSYFHRIEPNDMLFVYVFKNVSIHVSKWYILNIDTWEIYIIGNIMLV